jgi:hypothetical protein
MQDKGRNNCHNAATQHTCGTCAAIGKEVREDWMLPDEHYHYCPTTHARIGLVEEGDEWPCWKAAEKKTIGITLPR